jgi:hypothetical protein
MHLYIHTLPVTFKEDKIQFVDQQHSTTDYFVSKHESTSPSQIDCKIQLQKLILLAKSCVCKP